MQLISIQEARTQGLKRYFTGEPCKHGHVSERSVINSACCKCLKERRNTPEHKARQAEYRKNNIEKIKILKATHRKKPEVQASEREYGRAYRKKNLERIRAAARVAAAHWRINNPGRNAANSSAWRKADPSKQVALKAQRRAAKLERTPKWLTKEDKAAIRALYEQANFMSRVCGEPMHVDHIIPLHGKTVSGLHVPSNLQILTGAENVTKSNKLLEQFT